MGAQWLSGRVLDSRPKGRGFEPHRRHCVVVLEQDIYPSLVLVQPRKTRPYITERLLMGRKESNQTNKFYTERRLISGLASTLLIRVNVKKMLHNLGIHIHNHNILFLLLSKRCALLFCYVLIKKERSY